MGRAKKAKNKSKGRPKDKPKGKPKVKLQVKPAVEDQAAPANKPEDKPILPKTPSPQETRSKRTPYKGVLLPHPGELRFAPPPPSPPATSPLAAEPSELGGRSEDTPLHRYQQRHRKRGGIEQSIMIRRRLEDEMRKRQDEEERQEEEEENRIRTARVAQAAIIPLPGPRICRFCGVTFDPRANNACPNHQSKEIACCLFVIY